MLRVLAPKEAAPPMEKAKGELILICATLASLRLLTFLSSRLKDERQIKPSAQRQECVPRFMEGKGRSQLAFRGWGGVE